MSPREPVRCVTCRGEHVTQCPRCRGEGAIAGAHGPRLCPCCGGEGLVVCGTCRGQGVVAPAGAALKVRDATT